MCPVSLEIEPPRPCSFEPADWQILARHWYPVALSAAVGNAPCQATLLDEQLVLYRIGDELVVGRDVCPHRGVPLSLGTHDEGGIICRYHGLRYGAGGRCNRIPASPATPIPGRLRLHTYPAVERYGLVWTCLAPQSDTLPAIPDMPHWEDAEFQQIVCPIVDIACFAGRQVEGFLDVAHFGFVHAATFGDVNNLEVAPYVPRATPDGFEVEYRSQVGNYPIGAGGRAPADFEWLRHFRAHLPFTATLTIHFPDRGRLVIMNAASPASARKTRLFAPIARNFDKHIPVAEVHAFNLRIFEEDRLIVETQRPESLPLDLSMEAHIPADGSSIAYRRGLKRLGLGRFFLV
jgi:phenylpropionate dioxygenase-like ring-hydroxylating dioxygenase large terminal subunit